MVVDHSLAQRLEKAEACAGARFVEARARRDPTSRAEWIQVAGAYVMYDGAESPATQTFGLGLSGPVTAVDLDRIEAFYRERDSPAFHEVSPLAGVPFHAMLAARQYVPVEFTSVMFRELCPPQPATETDSGITVQIADPEGFETWARTAALGWSDSVDFVGALHDLMSVVAAREGQISFLAERNGEPIAAGALHLEEGVALLAGASTIPSARKLGAQRALLAARLRYAVTAGCDLAMICAEPGSASQRNAERHGFRIAYTRIKWKRG